MVSWPLADASAWFQNQAITAPVMQTNATDPLNDLNTRLTDGGWHNLTLKAGFTAVGPVTLTPAYRILAGVVYLRGYAAGTYSAGSTDDIVAAGGIPAGLRPANDRYVSCAANAVANAAFLIIRSDGSLTVRSGGTVPGWVSLAVAPWIGEV